MRLFILIILILTACGQDPDEILPIEGPTDQLEAQQPEILMEEYEAPELGEVVESGDTYTLELEKQEIDDGVFLSQKIVYEKADDGYTGTIELDFEGDKDTEYIYEVPKSFAEHVDDLVFSIPPDEIIEEDPVLKWIVKLQERRAAKIKIETAKAGLSGGKSAAAVELFSSLDDFKIQAALKSCGQEHTGYDQELCVWWVMAAMKDRFEYSDCDDMTPAMKNSCHALMGDGVGACYTYSGTDKETVINTCKARVFYALAFDCRNKYKGNKDKIERCSIEAVLDADFEYMCKEFINPFYQALCHVQFGTYDYCKELKGDQRTECCNILKDEDKKIDCMPEKEIPDLVLEDVKITMEEETDELTTNVRYKFFAEHEPEGYMFEWDFGDNENGKLFGQKQYTHIYKTDGDMEIHVQVLKDDMIVAEGKRIVTVNYPYTMEEMLMRIKEVAVSVCSPVDKQSTGKDPYFLNQGCIHISSGSPDMEVEWNGRLFLAYEDKETSSGKSHTKIEGAINDEMDEVLWLKAEFRSENTNGNTVTSNLHIESVPIKLKSPLPVAPTDWYKPMFIGYEKGLSAQQHVVEAKQVEEYPNHATPNYQQWFDVTTFREEDKKPYVEVILYTERISANDQPSYTDSEVR